MNKPPLSREEKLAYRLEMDRQQLQAEVTYWLNHVDAYWPRAWRCIGRSYGALHELASKIESQDAQYWQERRKEESAA